MEYAPSCARVVVVLSRDFLKHEWSHYQANFKTDNIFISACNLPQLYVDYYAQPPSKFLDSNRVS